MFRPFHATNRPGTCLWCGRKLRKHLGGRLGDYEDGFFCGLRCAYDFAVDMAKLGKRFEPKKTAPEPEPKNRYVYPKCQHCGAKTKIADIGSSSDRVAVACTNYDCDERYDWVYCRVEKTTSGHVTTVRYVPLDPQPKS